MAQGMLRPQPKQFADTIVVFVVHRSQSAGLARQATTRAMDEVKIMSILLFLCGPLHDNIAKACFSSKVAVDIVFSHRARYFLRINRRER